MKRPSVLYLTARMPYPPHSGGRLREYQLIRRLADRSDIHLWVVTKFPEIDEVGVDHMRPWCAQVRLFTADRRQSGPPDVPTRVWRQASDRASRELADFVRRTELDMVHVEGYYMTYLLPAGLHVPMVLVEENVEYFIEQSWSELGRGDSVPWKRIADMEREVWQRAAVCAAVSSEDADHIRSVCPAAKVRWSPNGSDHLSVLDPLADRPVERRAGGLTVTFIGNYAYPPTGDAAWRTLTEIWPMVAATVPDATLVLAGEGLTGDLLRAAREAPRVIPRGRVPAVSDVLDDSHVAIAPLRVGGGVKVKVLEAVARGCPFVGTSVAGQGLPDSLRAALVIRDDSEEFAAEVIGLLRDPVRRRDVSRQIRLAAAELPTWDQAAARLWDVWSEAFAQPAVAGRPPAGGGGREGDT
jgi:glycosyltransferase involved in cell wall biosynthesis